MKIAVYGAGAWGTALTVRWAARHAVTLVTRQRAHMQEMQHAQQNSRYLPGITFPPALSVAITMPAGADLIVLGIPTAGLRETLARLQPFRATPLLALCKGYVGEHATLPCAEIAQTWTATHGVLSGPSFAQEVARGLPAAVMLASESAAFANETAAALRDEALRIYPTTDVIGVEIGGAVKNVLAIAAGLCDGMRLGANARAALITRGLAEMTRLAIALGGKPETLAGLAGMGDLVLTCTGDLSRNRRVGLSLAQGLALDRIVAELGHVAEGIPAARNTLKRAQALGIEMPICAAIAQLLDGAVSAEQALAALLTRDVAAA